QGGRARGTTCPRGWRSKVAAYLRDRRRLPVTVALHPQQRGGEAAVLRAFPSATVLRPAVMFGPGDALLTPLLLMLRRLPVFPMFGDGRTRVHPAYVEDVGEASARVLQVQMTHQIYELAGPRIYTYRALLKALAARQETNPFCCPVPSLSGTRSGTWPNFSLAHQLLEIR